MTFIPSVLSKDDNNNTSNSILLSNNTFNGSSTSTIGYNYLIISILCDVSSSNNGLIISFSDDNINFDDYYFNNYTSNQKFIESFKIIKNYYKIRYINGSSNQTTFKLTTRLSTVSDNEYNNTISNNLINFDNNIESTKDAFNKLRVSNPLTLIDLKFPNDSSTQTEYLSNNMIIDYNESGSGTFNQTFGKGMGVYEIIGDGTNNTFISQSRKYATYQPGKSLLFLASCILNSSNNNSDNYSAYVGYFDDLNGVYFMNDNGIIKIGLRNDGSGSVVDTLISQDDWNIDSLNGNGISGITLDFSKTQLVVIDLEWLGVGRIRYGFYIYGRIYYVHQITNINQLTAPYMSSPNLPIRFQLNNNGSNNAYLTQICSTVISEGGYNPIGRSFSANNGITSISVDATETNLLAITGNTYYYHHNIIPTFINIIAGSNDAILYYVKIIYNCDSSGSTWNDIDLNNSVVKYSVGTNIVLSGGYIITLDSSYAIGKNTINFNDLSNSFNNILQLTSNIDNIPDIILISAQKVSGGSTDVYSSISWQEVY